MPTIDVPSSIPVAASTPYSCGIPGVYVSRHSSYGQENWVASSYAYVEVNASQGNSQYLSLKGSFLSDRDEYWFWFLSLPNHTNFHFYLDGDSIVEDWNETDDQYQCFFWKSLENGFRYSFYVTTNSSYSSGYIWMRFFNYYDNYWEDLGSGNCELCNYSGCIDTSYIRDSCPVIDVRATQPPLGIRSSSPIPASSSAYYSSSIPLASIVSIETEQGGNEGDGGSGSGDADSGGGGGGGEGDDNKENVASGISDFQLFVIIVVIVDVVVVAMIIVVSVCYRKRKQRKKIEDGENRNENSDEYYSE
jgi:uncharacterized membrane protein YgcG